MTFQNRVHAVIREWLPTVLLLTLLLAARSTLADHYHVPTGSMEHTLKPGDHVLVNKAAYGWRIPFTGKVIAGAKVPGRGEIVVFDSPDDGKRLIKRVVAVAGDSVSVKDGLVHINGRRLAVGDDIRLERYDEHEALINLSRGGGPDVPLTRIPAGKVLVLGDFRGNSHDGRYFGLVDASDLYGRATRIFFRRNDGFSWQVL
jgi:signal peptidase I